MEATGSNADQIKYWNEMAGAKWVAFQEALDRQIEGLGLAAMNAVRIDSDARVLDVGCGCGSTTLELARRVPTGSVLGVDVSSPMLARARERVAAEKVTNVTLVEGDAQVYPFPDHGFDVVFSRFGVMFFVEPVVAFTNLRRATRPGGRLVFACWQPLDVNPWMAVPARAAGTVITMPPPSPPGTPGPFAFDDPEYVRGILTGAGYSSIDIVSCKQSMHVGIGSLDDSARFAMQFGPAARALREAPAEVFPRVFDAVRSALVPFETADGVVLPAAVWIVTATA